MRGLSLIVCAMLLVFAFAPAFAEQSGTQPGDPNFDPALAAAADSGSNPGCATGTSPGSTDFAEGEACIYRRNIPIIATSESATPDGSGVSDSRDGSGWVSPFASPRKHGSHQGIDLSMPQGYPMDLPPGCKIYPCQPDGSTGACSGSPAADGTYPLFEGGGYGNFMLFDCSELAGGNAVCVRYAHLDSYNSDTGKAINGSSGNADVGAEHNHLEVIVDGTEVDPACVWGEWYMENRAGGYGELITGRIGGTRTAASPPCLSPMQDGTPVNLCDRAALDLLIEDTFRNKRKKKGTANTRGCSPGTGVEYNNYAGQGTFVGTGDPGDPEHDHDDGFKIEVKPDITEDDEGCTACCCPCTEPIINNHKKIRSHVDEFTPEEKDDENSEFEEHRKWLVYTFFHQHILKAAKQMTSQLTAVGLDQVQAIGRLLDAKHQLETQRLFQELKAQAHKDYHPSEGLCEIGTNVRSLAASERLSDLAHLGLSQKMIQRQLLSGENLAQQGPISDKPSRLENFISKFCNPADNGNGLNLLCGEGASDKDMRNADIDFTRTVDSQLTLDLNFSPIENGAGDVTKDEEKILAMTSNLISNDVFPFVDETILADNRGWVRPEAVEDYMNMRAIVAKRSVAANSLAALISMRASGDKEVAQFAKKLVEELGVSPEDIEEIMGKHPSYFAQMEVLTKTIYTNPTFFTELYDKPVNVDRKNLALRTIGLMQDRDIYKSLLRSEASMAVILEQMLQPHHERMKLEFGRLNDEAEGADQ